MARANVLSGAEGALQSETATSARAPKGEEGIDYRNNGRDCWLLNAGDLFLWIAYAAQSDCFDPLYVAGSQSQAKG